MKIFVYINRLLKIFKQEFLKVKTKKLQEKLLKM